jgi:hypothetical protein
VNAVAISAKNFALGNFSQQFVHGHFRVLANAKQFVALYMVEIERRRMSVKAAHCTTMLSLDLVD